MSRNRASKEDPRGIIAESFHMDGLTEPEARSIFMDWAMIDAGANARGAMQILLERYRADNPEHPMTKILEEGVKLQAQTPKRRGRAHRISAKDTN